MTPLEFCTYLYLWRYADLRNTRIQICKRQSRQFVPRWSAHEDEALVWGHTDEATSVRPRVRGHEDEAGKRYKLSFKLKNDNEKMILSREVGNKRSSHFLFQICSKVCYLLVLWSGDGWVVANLKGFFAENCINKNMAPSCLPQTTFCQSGNLSKPWSTLVVRDD